MQCSILLRRERISFFRTCPKPVLVEVARSSLRPDILLRAREDRNSMAHARRKLPKGLSQRPGGHYMRDQRRGRDRRVNLGTDLDFARRLLREYKARGLPLTSGVTFEEAAARWLRTRIASAAIRRDNARPHTLGSRQLRWRRRRPGARPCRRACRCPWHGVRTPRSEGRGQHVAGTRPPPALRPGPPTRLPLLPLPPVSPGDW